MTMSSKGHAHKARIMPIQGRCPFEETILQKSPTCRRKNTNPSKCNRSQEDQNNFHEFSCLFSVTWSSVHQYFNIILAYPVGLITVTKTKTSGSWTHWTKFQTPATIQGVVLPDQLHEASPLRNRDVFIYFHIFLY